MSKYDSLRTHLTSRKNKRWRATFSEIERVLGFELPPSARKYQAWWANESGTQYSQKLAWSNAGWRTTNLNLTAETVEFEVDDAADLTRNAVRTRTSEPSFADRQSERPDFWLDKVLERLAMVRPIFHSEADFQHALAWSIRELNHHDPVRLEFKPVPEERIHIDIWIGRQPPVAIELKYPTRATLANVNGEHFALTNQSAQDLTRYDFLKDVARIERISQTFPGASGFAALLTNDRSYWLPSRRETPVDDAFRLFDGRSISGELAWLEHAGAGTVKRREQPVSIRGTYDLSWRPYSRVGKGTYGEFRYLLIAVNPSPQ